jgi:hypothetical protein
METFRFREIIPETASLTLLYSVRRTKLVRIHSDTFQIHIITWGLPGDLPTRATTTATDEATWRSSVPQTRRGSLTAQPAASTHSPSDKLATSGRERICILRLEHRSVGLGAPHCRRDACAPVRRSSRLDLFSRKHRDNARR